MSTPSGSAGGNGKFCTVCKQDVANKPRTKDAKGRYFCQPCYQKAIAGQRQRAQPVSAAASLEAAENAVSPSVLEHLLDVEPAHAAMDRVCPSCRANVPAGGFMCVNCGFNLQTNQAAGAVRVKTQRAAGGTVWPYIVGITSMVIGAGGTVVYGLYFVLALLGSMKAQALGQAIFTVLPVGSLLTGLALWVFRDGLRIVRRDAEGVKWIRYWAMAKILLYGTCLAVFMSIPAGPMEQALAQADSKLTVADIKSSILLVLGWFLFWPVFVMVFFFVPRIQEDVEAWG